jgi:hypothetical protein
MVERLKKVTDIIHAYESGAYKDLFKMQRLLVCNIHFLTDEQVKANVEWNKQYHNHKSTVNAVKTRYADSEVPELYMLRHILKTATNVQIAISQEIKRN